MLGRDDGPPATAAPVVVGPDPLSFDASRTTAYERAVAFGLGHVLYAKSPGGVVAAAGRTARYRELVEEAVQRTGIDADTLEAMVLLESAGRPDAVAGDDPAHAAGLTQIVAETATNLLGMRVDLPASRRLTQAIEAAERRGDVRSAGLLRAARRRVDARFDPAQALAGAVRYLEIARQRLGRDDLAVVSYHMGIGNVEGVLRSYADSPDGPIAEVVSAGDLSWARLYFDSSPARHAGAWLRLTQLGDDSQTYYGRVLAAREIMRLFRDDPAQLEQLARLHGRGPSAEQVLHPAGTTERFARPEDLAGALEEGRLAPLPDDPELRFRVGPGIGEAAYRGLRPEALRLLRYLAARVYDLGGAEAPLTVTRAAYDEEYGRLLAARDPGLSAHVPLHATGYSFDVRRRYGSGAQAAALQYVLERLEALGLIAWMRDRSVIHVTVASQAATLAAPP